MYNATKLFRDGELFSASRSEIGAAILEADATAANHSHESKLIRIEIGAAIRRVAVADEIGLTDTISNLNLCELNDRSEKTFLKYARVAGVPALLDLAVDPAVSFTVLDEIAASKKPNDPAQHREFVSRVCNEVKETNKRIRESEGLTETAEDRLRAPGITRNDTIGVIRRAQIEFEVPTRAVPPGGSPREREANKQQENLRRIARLVRAANCARAMLMYGPEFAEWSEREGMTHADVRAAFDSAIDKLVADGLLKEDPFDLLAGSIKPEAYLPNVETGTPEEEKEKEAAA